MLGPRPLQINSGHLGKKRRKADNFVVPRGLRRPEMEGRFHYRGMLVPFRRVFWEERQVFLTVVAGLVYDEFCSIGRNPDRPPEAPPAGSPDRPRVSGSRRFDAVGDRCRRSNPTVRWD
jgi:hypothetical protein